MSGETDGNAPNAPSTPTPTPMFGKQDTVAARSRSGFFVGLGVVWVLIGITALAIFSHQKLSLHQTPPTSTSRQWSPAIVWKPPDGTDDAIKGCKDWACLYGVLQQNGAPAETIEFLHAEQQSAPTDDLGYPIALRGSGLVKLVEIFVPGFDMEGGSDFVFANGADGIVRPKIDINQMTNSSAEFQKFKLAYPQVELWGAMTFNKEVSLPNGAQQFQFAQTLLDGCHACAVLGTLNIGFDFDGSGHYTGMSVLGVDPDKDAPYGALADDLAQKSQFYQIMNLAEPDGSNVSAQTQTSISEKAHCKFSVDADPTMTTGGFTFDQKFDIKDVQVQRSSVAPGASDRPTPPPSNELTISCANANNCISPIYSNRNGAENAVPAVTVLVTQENVDAVMLDIQKLQSICDQN